MFDDELMEALRETFAKHLEKKQEISAHTVVMSLLGYAVFQLSYLLWTNPERVEETKQELIKTFEKLLNSINKEETKH